LLLLLVVKKHFKRLSCDTHTAFMLN